MSSQPFGRTPRCLASTARTIRAFISPKPGRARSRASSSAASRVPFQTAAASLPYSTAMVAHSAWTRRAMLAGNRWMAGLVRNAASKLEASIAAGLWGARRPRRELAGVETPEAPGDLERPEEGLLDGDLLVEAETDQQRERVARHQPVRLGVAGPLHFWGCFRRHAESLARRVGPWA